MQEPLDAELCRDVAHHVGAVAVGPHEYVGVEQRAIDVALCGEVHHLVASLHRVADRVAIADVAVHEAEPRIVLKVGEALAIARIGQRVEDDDLIIGGGQDVAGEVGTDETGGTGDEKLHVRIPQVRSE